MSERALSPALGSCVLLEVRRCALSLSLCSHALSLMVWSKHPASMIEQQKPWPLSPPRHPSKTSAVEPAAACMHVYMCAAQT